MPRIIPLVLPLSILLASIMTFGNLAENYEFAAIKSSGISLQRAMRSLTVFILLLSIIAFFSLIMLFRLPNISSLIFEEILRKYSQH
jgi:lipopolysaccharide export LptBFGC system permease protein LptF